MLEFLVLFAPACAGVLLYDKYSPGKRSAIQLVLGVPCLALVTNMLAYAANYLRGHESIAWPQDNIMFCLKYMGLSLLFACLLAAAAIGVHRLLLQVKAGKENGSGAGRKNRSGAGRENG